ncbi:MAG: phosphoribosylamine--glycine ligase [Actinomycetota bacterium]
MGHKVLVVGGGGREHALVWGLLRSPQVDEVLAAPGNPGMAAEEGCHVVPETVANDLDGIVALAQLEAVSLVVVGPEDPLVAGVVDRLAEVGIAAFGPSEAAAQLEGSKAHCKEFLLAHDIPTGAAATFTDADEAIAYLDGLDAVPVVKADGLAAGKGVIVAESREEAAAAVRDILVDRRFGDAGNEVLLEERLTGPEVSVLAFCDGTDYVLMPAAQDHKRLLVGDVGPNTGGMGAFHPSPIADTALLAEVASTVIEPTLAGMAAEGRPYKGVLYAGMMLTEAGPKVIEFNCRFGDPECQVVIPLMESDLYATLQACVEGRLAATDVQWADQAAVTVVLASGGYPVSSAPPAPIEGLDTVPDDCVVFHAGTKLIDGVVQVSGGRVLAVTSVKPTLAEAAEAAHAGVAAIDFDGAQHRTDIARATAEVRA